LKNHIFNRAGTMPRLRYPLALLLIAAVISVIISSKSPAPETQMPIAPPVTVFTPDMLQIPQLIPELPTISDEQIAAIVPPPQPRTEHYTIQPGDTLEKIFRHFSLSMNDLHDILQTDEQYLVMDVIRPDTELTFQFDPDNHFQSVSLQTSMVRTVTYERSDNGFVFSENILPTEWQQYIVRADVSSTLYGTIIKTGLSDADAMEITQLMSSRVNFARELRPGDTFDAIVSDEYLNDIPTGNRRLDAIKLNVHGDDYVAIRFDDGNYYDEKANSLTPALLRYPTRIHYRVTSPFNPNRHHPVTHRFAPHNGVDTAAPVGTPVLATGNGIVTRVVRHPYAGLYVEIDDDGPYTTRFLHLSKALVHKGQRVKRGEKIALSGNTGRTTGPHLHYELHINGRPVNPMTAKIPTMASVPDKDKAHYRELVDNFLPMLSREQISLNNVKPAQG